LAYLRLPFCSPYKVLWYLAKDGPAPADQCPRYWQQVQRLTKFGQTMDETDDLDLLVVMEGNASLSPAVMIEQWRANLSMFTAFRIDLHPLEGRDDHKVDGMAIYRRRVG
jgi:hypothetical protein